MPAERDGAPALPIGAGTGLATVAADGSPLDIWFPEPGLCADAPMLGSRPVSAQACAAELGADYAALLGEDPLRGVRRVAIRVTIELAAAPADFYDLFLRLHLLSHRAIAPRQANLDGFLALLNHDVAWTSLGPCPAGELERIRLRAQARGLFLSVKSVFGAPPMLDYVRPAGVRIADASRVFLGAHLAAGTMVTPEGFCGVNAGTLGPCMVEGRISAGVTVGAGSHVGGGASIMGTISGGNREVVSIGERCLLGANAGTGISLGEGCVVEAGCYVTAGVPVRLEDGRTVKARELAGRAHLLFRRHAASGCLEALERRTDWGGLHPDLHGY